jgi:hypothetical protein
LTSGDALELKATRIIGRRAVGRPWDDWRQSDGRSSNWTSQIGRHDDAVDERGAAGRLLRWECDVAGWREHWAASLPLNHDDPFVQALVCQQWRFNGQ